MLMQVRQKYAFVDVKPPPMTLLVLSILAVATPYRGAEGRKGKRSSRNKKPVLGALTGSVGEKLSNAVRGGSRDCVQEVGAVGEHRTRLCRTYP